MNLLQRALIEKAGCEHGWEIVVESKPAAVVLASARHRAKVHILPDESGRFQINVPEGLIQRELARSFPEIHSPAGTFPAADMDALTSLLHRTAELAHSLPHQAARTYEERLRNTLKNLPPGGTEAEQTIRRRIGQDTFREALMDYWGGACAVTGIDLPELLRASHAKPWADCETDRERLDVFNGFLLCANLDALFDRGLITFDLTGRMICSPRLNAAHRAAMNIRKNDQLRWIAPEHKAYLIRHHILYGFQPAECSARRQ